MPRSGSCIFAHSPNARYVLVQKKIRRATSWRNIIAISPPKGIIARHRSIAVQDIDDDGYPDVIGALEFRRSGGFRMSRIEWRVGLHTSIPYLDLATRF